MYSIEINTDLRVDSRQNSILESKYQYNEICATSLNLTTYFLETLTLHLMFHPLQHSRKIASAYDTRYVRYDNIPSHSLVVVITNDRRTTTK